MFIKKNADKWNKYQHEPATNPDETAERFVNLIDDLSYAKTFYPRSKVTRWVNGIAAGIYQSIYKNKKEKYSRIFQFWKFELPLLFKRYHRIFLFTTLIFCLFVAIGVFSSMQNEEFVRGVLGDGYVDMTEENISKGDPFGVYKDDNPFSMFVRIGLNNIRVGGFFIIYFWIYAGYTYRLGALAKRYYAWCISIHVFCKRAGHKIGVGYLDSRNAGNILHHHSGHSRLYTGKRYSFSGHLFPVRIF